MALNRREELSYLLIFQRGNLCPRPLGENGQAGRVDLQIADSDGLLQGAVENTVDILDRLGVKGLAVSLFVFQMVDEPLDMNGSQFPKGFLAQGGPDVVFDGGLIGFPGLCAADVLCEPGVQPIGEGHFGRLYMSPRVQFCGDLRQLFPNFL